MVIAQFGSSGTWIVTTAAVSSGTITDILARLGIRNARENLRTIGLVDGVHVGTTRQGLTLFARVNWPTACARTASSCRLTSRRPRRTRRWGLPWLPMLARGTLRSAPAFAQNWSKRSADIATSF